MFDFLFSVFAKAENFWIATGFFGGYIYLLYLRKKYKVSEQLVELKEIDIFLCSVVLFFLFFYLSIFSTLPIAVNLKSSVNLLSFWVFFELFYIIVAACLGLSEWRYFLNKKLELPSIHSFLSLLKLLIVIIILSAIYVLMIYLLSPVSFFNIELRTDLIILSVLCFFTVVSSAFLVVIIIKFSNYIFEISPRGESH